MARETRNRPPLAASFGAGASGSRPPEIGILRKEGEYWTVGYRNSAFRLKDTKGLRYISLLLRHPRIEFHVLDLAGGVAGQHEDNEAAHSVPGLPHGNEDLEKAGIHIGSLGDAGEMLDDTAKVAYRRRLSELREELDEAKKSGRVDRAVKVEREIDALTSELSRAVGLGGRSRRAGSASERARQSVSKTIKSVLDRIAQSDAALGDILSRCIKTGTFCTYEPDRDCPTWEFDTSTTERVEPTASSSALPPARIDHSHTSPAVLEISPFSFASRTAFVGREPEHKTIRAAIDRALTGHGSLVMLSGGPGVGKTRLAMEMAEYASRVGFSYLVGHCYERDERFPFLPFAEMIESNLAEAPSLEDFRRRMGDNAPELAQIAPALRRVYPDIPQPLELPPAQQRRRLFQSVSDLMANGAQTRSIMYIAEDLHWADESSLALLIHLASRVSQIPAIIIGTYRGGYFDSNPALVRTLEELIRMGIRPLKLGGLSKDDTAQILRDLSRREAVPESLASLIFEESQGYPFFVEEVYRHLFERGKVFDDAGQFRTDIEIAENEVPENVRLIIGRRLERLNENERRVLAAAAVIGRSFSFKVLAAICEIDTDDLFTVVEKGQQMGIVANSHGAGSPFTFTHELVRQTLLAGISAPRRQHLRAGIANAARDSAREIGTQFFNAGSYTDGEQSTV